MFDCSSYIAFPISLPPYFVDERRMKIVEMGGAQELVNMLGVAKDDSTRKEALKALLALSHSGQSFILSAFEKLLIII